MKKTIYRDEYRELIDWLRTKRSENKLSQRELAILLDWDNATIARVETQERRLDIVEFVEICNALKCDPQEGLALIIQSLHLRK